ncbi:hypothetical protein BDR04DRAFT_986489, partial [Suillus decipiens]
LAWFWSIEVQDDSTSNDWTNECMRFAFFRVHWLRTLALRDRWTEELLLVGREIMWTADFL